tara:strand:- start:28438 stop:31458 length:3021 start_codon:yes stop_codon:yes gene_type:complete
MQGGRRGFSLLVLLSLILWSFSGMASPGKEDGGVGSAVCESVCISEVMPNADGPDQGVFPQGEWVELVNYGDSDVNLYGWAIVDIGGWYHPINEQSWVGFDSLSSPYVLRSGGYAIIAENEIGTLRLNNAGETVYLVDDSNQTVDEIVTGSASNGISKIADPSNTGGTWIDSIEPSPGNANPGDGEGDGPVDIEASWWDGEFDVKFTRIMPGEVPNRNNDWFEITNIGDDVVNLEGWNITRVSSSGEFHSTIKSLEIMPGSSVVISENPYNLLMDGGIAALDANQILTASPWLVNSGGSLILAEPNGTAIDSIVYGNGIAGIDGWIGPAISVPGDGSPGLILMRGLGCGEYPDSDTGSDWEQRWIRIGASTFCDGGDFLTEQDSTAIASIGPESTYGDLRNWIDTAQSELHLHVYQFMSTELTGAVVDAIDRGVEVTLLLEDGILDGASTVDNQRGHAQAVHDAGGLVLWMEDPSQISSPYRYIHSKVAVKDSESVWISSGNWKETSAPVDQRGNREWSLIVNSVDLANLVLSRMEWDENQNSLHISTHQSRHSPSSDWTMDSAQNTTSLNTPEFIAGPFDGKLITCPDDCVASIVQMISSAESSIDLSVQYLDLDWYWGFGENPMIEALHEAAIRGVQIRLILNGFYAEWDDEIRDTVNLFNTDWNATQGLDTTARLMSTSENISKLHNKGAIIDGSSVLVGSMNWGSSAALRNREMGILINNEELASEYLSSFDMDWGRMDSSTDSDGDLMPDFWEELYGLNRHSAAVIGTALSEQSMDPDFDGLNNLNEYLLGGNPLEVDTDGDCIFDGNEEAFAQSVLRSPNIAMLSGDVDENGIPDGEQWGCDEVTSPEPVENETGEEPDEVTAEEDDEEGFLDIREDAMSRPGASLLFGLMAISAVALLIASWTSFRRPRSATDEILVDDSGYRFDDSGSKLAILKGTSFDRDSADSRSLTKGKDDGSHGDIVLDGFGFDRDRTTRDEIQWRLDSGQTMEEIRKDLGEEE